MNSKSVARQDKDARTIEVVEFHERARKVAEALGARLYASDHCAKDCSVRYGPR